MAISHHGSNCFRYPVWEKKHSSNVPVFCAYRTHQTSSTTQECTLKATESSRLWPRTWADRRKLLTSPSSLKNIDLNRYVTKTTGLPTLTDIISELEKPGRDPRASAKVMEFDDRVTSLNDIKTGMELNGIVNNITAFGVFVDLGIKENGLVHISQLCERFISSPAEVYAYTSMSRSGL